MKKMIFAVLGTSMAFATVAVAQDVPCAHGRTSLAQDSLCLHQKLEKDGEQFSLETKKTATAMKAWEAEGGFKSPKSQRKLEEASKRLDALQRSIGN